MLWLEVSGERSLYTQSRRRVLSDPWLCEGSFFEYLNTTVVEDREHEIVLRSEFNWPVKLSNDSQYRVEIEGIQSGYYSVEYLKEVQYIHSRVRILKSIGTTRIKVLIPMNNSQNLNSFCDINEVNIDANGTEVFSRSFGPILIRSEYDQYSKIFQQLQSFREIQSYLLQENPGIYLLRQLSAVNLFANT